MTRLPFLLMVAAVTAAAWLIASAVRPASAPGVAVGAAVAGLFAAAAVGVLRRVRARGVAAGVSPQEAMQGLVKGFAGLMVARMVGYLTFLGAVVATRTLEPFSVCVGLVCGTVVFQALEVMYVRKLAS
jgi:hypothetical protein